MAEHEKSFNIIGGWTGGSLSDRIYKYNTGGGGQWVELTTTLSRGKYDMTAIKVKSSFFPSC